MKWPQGSGLGLVGKRRKAGAGRLEKFFACAMNLARVPEQLLMVAGIFFTKGSAERADPIKECLSGV